MRIITEKAVEAFLNETPFQLDNTRVTKSAMFVSLELHGNVIARRELMAPRRIEVTTAGWNTVTTKARLNGIPGVRVYTKAGQLYLNGVAWNGDWRNV